MSMLIERLQIQVIDAVAGMVCTELNKAGFKVENGWKSFPEGEGIRQPVYDSNALGYGTEFRPDSGSTHGWYRPNSAGGSRSDIAQPLTSEKLKEIIFSEESGIVIFITSETEEVWSVSILLKTALLGDVDGTLIHHDGDFHNFKTLDELLSLVKSNVK